MFSDPMIKQRILRFATLWIFASHAPSNENWRGESLLALNINVLMIFFLFLLFLSSFSPCPEAATKTQKQQEKHKHCKERQRRERVITKVNYAASSHSKWRKRFFSLSHRSTAFDGKKSCGQKVTMNLYFSLEDETSGEKKRKTFFPLRLLLHSFHFSQKTPRALGGGDRAREKRIKTMKSVC